MDKFEMLNQIFRLHRLFRQNERFTDSIDMKHFLCNSREIINPLLIHIQYGGEITYTQPTTFECVDNPYFILIYVEKGEVLIKSDEVIRLNQNSLLLFSPGTNFRFDTKTTPCNFHMFLLSGENIRPFAEHIRLLSHSSNHVASQLIYLHRLMTQPGISVPFLISRTLTDLLTDSILIQARNDSVSKDSQVPSHIQEMKNIMEQEYSKSLTLDQFEQRLLISKFRLCREFSFYYGISPLQYLNQLRIQESKSMLLETDISIHAIASGVGIPNTSHFIKLFKRETNLTPAEYRKEKSS